jgi:putative transposase
LFLETLHSYRGRAYQLHEYVLMPDHFHILLTPCVTLERAVQFIKGGFSFRVKKELQSSMEIWQTGFSDHRIRNGEDYGIHVEYIYRNPVGRKLAERAAEYPYCSALPGSQKDEVPQWLKPLKQEQIFGAPEGAPLQNQRLVRIPQAATAQKVPHCKVPEGAFLRKTARGKVAEAVTLQRRNPNRAPEVGTGAANQQQIPRYARDDNFDSSDIVPESEELLSKK